jgi:glycosyltransferase involved in cell wall biosynthesis
MRVLHVAEAFGGGIFEMVSTLATGLAGDGHEAAIAYGTRPETPPFPRAAIDPRVELFDLRWMSRSLAAHVDAGRALRSAIDDWDPDVVHLHSSFAGLVGTLTSSSRKQIVYSPHCYASSVLDEGRFRAAGFRLVERFVSRRATVVGVVSRSEAEVARRCLARRVEIVENGIPELEEDRLAERPLPERPRIVAVGRTVPQRRPEACARILAALGDAADVAWLGGGGGVRGDAGFAALAAAGIRPTGWMPRDEVLAELERATVYLHWTSWDGQALSLLEAMAYDAVVVASDTPPNREVVGPAQVCDSEAEAIRLLRRIVSDREFAQRLLAAQRERRHHFRASRMVRDWLAAYERLVGETAAPRIERPAVGVGQPAAPS